MTRKGAGSEAAIRTRGRIAAKTPPSVLMDNLMETSNAIIIGIDSTGVIRLFNNGARRALGYTSEEVFGTSWFDLLTDEDAEKGRLEVFQFDIGSGARTQYESRVRSSSGLTVTILLENTVVFGPDGDISMVLMIGQDITRTKELERTLKFQNARLESTLEELGLYTDLLLHDMKNANAITMACLDLLELETEGDKRGGLVQKAVAEVLRSTSIIDDVKVLALTRPIWEPTPVDIDELLSRSMKRALEGHEGKCPKFDVESSGLRLMADDLLEEALVRVYEDLMISSEAVGRIKVEVRRDVSRSDLIPQPVRLSMSIIGRHSGRKTARDTSPDRNGPEHGSAGLGMFIVKRIIGRYNGLLFDEMTDDGRTVVVVLSEAV